MRQLTIEYLDNSFVEIYERNDSRYFKEVYNLMKQNSKTQQKFLNIKRWIMQDENL